jgi:hypothetical protein
MADFDLGALAPKPMMLFLWKKPRPLVGGSSLQGKFISPFFCIFFCFFIIDFNRRRKIRQTIKRLARVNNRYRRVKRGPRPMERIKGGCSAISYDINILDWV